MKNFKNLSHLIQSKVFLSGTVFAVLLAGLSLKATSQGQKSFIAHEWGTYTSVVGSDGKDIQGLHEGDEELPTFVHTPVIGTYCSYAGCYSELRPEEGSPLAVTQRLETPVIYFYSDEEMDVNVNVGFPKGVVSEWYPQAQSFYPRREEFTSVSDGSIRWDIRILQGEQEVLGVSPDSVWAPSRNVPANYIQSEGENERFIFYRGIGRFKAPFSVRETRANVLKLSNSSGDAIESAILLRTDGEKGVFQSLGGIPSQASVTLENAPTLESPQALPFEEYVEKAAFALKHSLELSGLTSEESQAMVDTWRVSYFKTPGTRILYIAPRAWTDAILPIQFSPAPAELERTLVGRVEILSIEEERKLLRDLERMAVAQPDPGPVQAGAIASSLGRFHEPKLRRAIKLATRQNLESVRDFAQKVLDRL